MKRQHSLSQMLQSKKAAIETIIELAGIDTHYTLTSGESDGLAVSSSSYITSSDSDSVDSGTLQLVYGVASASETATGALSSSVSLSPHHLPTGH